jgi:hypothetical protein
VDVDLEAHPAGGLLGKPVQEMMADRDRELAVLDVDEGDLLAKLHAWPPLPLLGQ